MGVWLVVLCIASRAFALADVAAAAAVSDDARLCAVEEQVALLLGERDALRRELAASREDVAQFVEADSAAVSGAGLPEETHRRLGAHEETVADDLDALLLMVGAVSVFSMQSGFAMLEVGMVSRANTKDILLKNLADVSIASLGYWAVGWALSFGSDAYLATGQNGFSGTSGFFLQADEDLSRNGKLYGQAKFFFQCSFAATSGTIVSGAVAERCKIEAYFVSALMLAAVIYPIIVHLFWSDDGLFSAHRTDNEMGSRLLFGCGVIDFAGSGTVHLTGGTAAVVAAYVIGPRKGRFENGVVKPMPQQSVVLHSLGTLILWTGWFFFNGASTGVFVGNAGISAHAMANTLLSGSAACITSTLGHYWSSGGTYDPSSTCNGILSGLVAITAGCATSKNSGAVATGAVAGVLYLFASAFVEWIRIDDVVGAVSVHGVCGAWGLIAASLFAVPWYYHEVFPDKRRSEMCAGVFYGGDGSSLAGACVAILVNCAWTGATIYLLFVAMRSTIGVYDEGCLREDDLISEDLNGSRHGQVLEMLGFDQVPGPANAFGVHSPNGTLSVSFSNPNLAIFSDPDRLHSMTGSDLEQEETNRIVEA